jgi:deoxyribodipyrimidine photo-lyase
MYKRVIYWFKRDLRIEDNKALYEACIKSKELIPIFIFIPELLEKFEAFDKRLGFIIDCLKSLNKKINEKGSTLYVFYDSAEKVFPYLIKKYKPQAVFTNKSFSYTSEEIEKKVIEICKRNGIDYNAYSDNFLCNIENLPYKKIFSYFYNKWKENLILETYASPNKINTPKINETQLEQIIRKIKYQPNPIWKVDFIYSRLENFDFKNYEHTRNRLDIDGTSKLSPYIRFGVVSLRNVYKKALNASGEDCQFIKELAWREFWYHIKINFPQFKNLEFQEKRRGIKWQRDDKLLNAFIEAKTGYPIIDASIRQLKNENWMHNRARMIVASFFTKDLFMDWREGERFFMKYLIDYDEIVNIGNWQWNASVGADPKPLRIFNPIIQAKKFDPEGNFIKKYVSELKKYPTNMIHDPLKFQLPYHKPVVDHFERVIMIKKTFFKMYHKENI